jgi:hypothetical protein
MRTTLEIEDTIHELARRRAFEQRRSIGEVISEWATRGFAAETAPPTQRPLGAFRGEFTIADDFDEPLDEIETALDEPLL